MTELVCLRKPPVGMLPRTRCPRQAPRGQVPRRPGGREEAKMAVKSQVRAERLQYKLQVYG